MILQVGTLNTAVLICSSLTVAQAVRAAQMGKRMLQVKLLLATLFFGLVFLGVKAYEWNNKYKEHHIPTFDFNAQDLMRDNQKLFGLDKLQGDPQKAQRTSEEGSRNSGALADFLLALFRADRYARHPHDYWRRHFQRDHMDGMEGAIHARISHAA